MIQPKTQTRDYWEHEFTLNEADIEHINNHFLEVEQPQSPDALVHAVMANRINAERAEIGRRLDGRAIYRPSDAYKEGDELVFPLNEFAQGKVASVRDGNNAQEGAFKVIIVDFDGKQRLYAAELTSSHALSLDNGADRIADPVDIDEVATTYGYLVREQLQTLMHEREDFIRLGGMWFIRPLLVDINIGHLHLAEAVLEMDGGGPLETPEIMVHLDLDEGVDELTQTFSLNFALLEDDRFDEVAPRGYVAWYLRRMQRESVLKVPEVLIPHLPEYDRDLLNDNLKLLERELADEWSDLTPSVGAESVRFTLLYPHRASGTLPLNSTLRKLLPLGQSSRQLFTAVDPDTDQAFPVWVMQDHRYIFGFREWFRDAGVPIGGYITVSAGEDDDEFFVRCDRRKPQREDVRLASVEETNLRFELSRRSVACGYDDMMVVGTEFASAIEGYRKRVARQERTLAWLLSIFVPELSDLIPQNAVHAKTLYGAVNMVYRVPPGQLFSELVRNPAFQSVGDQYWMFDRQRWNGS